MKYKVFEDTIAIRLNKGDELLTSLKEVCEKEKVKLGFVTGIGATDHAVVGVYEVQARQYHANTFEGEMEITNVTGNVSQKDGTVYLHLHATMADKEGRALGGHLNEARISAAGELYLHCLRGEVFRVIDPETGLNMMEWEN